MTDTFALSFFTVSRYQYHTHEVCDFTDSPRPHYCMGLVLSGRARFEFEGQTVAVKPGEIIFVPVGSRYRSVWDGDPDVTYISMHFFFMTRPPMDLGRQLDIQVIRPRYEGEFLPDFQEAMDGFHGGSDRQMTALGCFYRVMGRLLPRLCYGAPRSRDRRMEQIAAYLETHCRERVSVEELAGLCHISVSHLHACFKAAYGMTPIEYKHRVCVRQAILALLRGGQSVEEISGELGFENTAYFRRVFRKVTGCAPTEYADRHTGL